MSSYVPSFRRKESKLEKGNCNNTEKDTLLVGKEIDGRREEAQDEIQRGAQYPTDPRHNHSEPID